MAWESRVVPAEGLTDLGGHPLVSALEGQAWLSLATACANSVSGQWLMRSIRWGPVWDDSEAWGGTWPRHIPGAGPEARTAVPARALIFESFWLRSLKLEPTLGEVQRSGLLVHFRWPQPVLAEVGEDATGFLPTASVCKQCDRKGRTQAPPPLANV